jgi:hypothetical protein
MLTSEIEAQILSSENRRLRKIQRYLVAAVYILLGLLAAAVIVVAAFVAAIEPVAAR